jgi:hypothetical protein
MIPFDRFLCCRKGMLYHEQKTKKEKVISIAKDPPGTIFFAMLSAGGIDFETKNQCQPLVCQRL